MAWELDDDERDAFLDAFLDLLFGGEGEIVDYQFEYPTPPFTEAIKGEWMKHYQERLRDVHEVEPEKIRYYIKPFEVLLSMRREFDKEDSDNRSFQLDLDVEEFQEKLEKAKIVPDEIPEEVCNALRAYGLARNVRIPDLIGENDQFETEEDLREEESAMPDVDVHFNLVEPAAAQATQAAKTEAAPAPASQASPKAAAAPAAPAEDDFFSDLAGVTPAEAAAQAAQAAKTEAAPAPGVAGDPTAGTAERTARGTRTARTGEVGVEARTTRSSSSTVALRQGEPIIIKRPEEAPPSPEELAATARREERLTAAAELNRAAQPLFERVKDTIEFYISEDAHDETLGIYRKLLAEDPEICADGGVALTFAERSQLVDLIPERFRKRQPS